MLYIVGTAIGNIEDTTMRAVKTLTSVDVILAEDTRSFGMYYHRVQKLFTIFSKEEQKIISFHDRNEYQRIPQVIGALKKGRNVALVSESGMPIVCDPGTVLLKHLIKNNLSHAIIPGPTAFVSAAVLSGFGLDRILFIGFFPKKKQAQLRLINQLKEMSSGILKPLAIVFYESPNRINKTLAVMAKTLPKAQIVICREMTKKFEEVSGQKEIVDRLKAFVAQKNLPHLLFSGPAGVGKSTLSLIIARELFGGGWKSNFLELNASDERGIDVVRNTRKDFARTKSLANIPFKIIFLDECDSLTKDAQQALRRTMETYAKTTRFVLGCNYSSKIIDPIVSRCAVFRFKQLN